MNIELVNRMEQTPRWELDARSCRGLPVEAISLCIGSKALLQKSKLPLQIRLSLSNPMQTKKEGMKIGVKSPNFLVPWKAEENRDADFEISRGFLSPPSSYGSRFPTVPFRSLASSTLSGETAFSLPHFHIHFSTFKHISSNIIRALPNSENSTNDLGASVINVDSTATTYAVSCDATAELVHDSTPISCIWETVGRQIFTQ
ncbi:hypothetical protein BKA61DRAFT_578982 [Leptodontidium sp. MPI-SDFR-AT-0119]|nr:hypothetical protein BKA61DRAFT_578982 [Leptodontidium sp. MPI-SDFR-AT-0119]